MTTKDYLSQAYRVDRLITSKLQQVQSLKELATRATSTLSDVPRGGSRNNHRMEDIIAKMIDLENEINGDIDQLVDLKRAIIAAVKGVPEPEQRILLELRYLCFKSWGEIAADMRYSKDYVFELHRKALAAIPGFSEKNETPQ
jgi:DNA-directed RNA polymerase specialized sigma subunit